MAKQEQVREAGQLSITVDGRTFSCKGSFTFEQGQSQDVEPARKMFTLPPGTVFHVGRFTIGPSCSGDPEKISLYFDDQGGDYPRAAFESAMMTALREFFIKNF